MAALINLVKMMQRAKDGPSCDVKEWDVIRVPQSVKKYLKKYDLNHTFNRKEPVNQDLSLADRFFEAGLELAAEIGLFCVDTETIIKVSKDEILKAIEDAPDHLVLGEGTDQVIIKTRQPEDEKKPTFAATLGSVSEDLYVPLVEGILKSKKVRILVGPTIDTVFGVPVYAGTPYETVVGFRENQLRKEAQWRAGRVGMPNVGIASSSTEYGHLGGFAELTQKTNPALAPVLHPSELKISYASFHKAAVARGYNGFIYSGCPSMIGGYSGGPEGAALANIATDLLQFPILQADVANSSLYDVRIDSVCGRHGLWAMSISCQAMSRNTHVLIYKVINQSYGPCTEEILYANAAGLINAAASGMSWTIGVRSAGGRYVNYVTPLEAWFCAQLFEDSAGVSLEKANEMVLYLLTKYEGSLKSPSKGKSFPECFDVKTLSPIKEWQKISDRVKIDLQNQGMLLN